MVWYGMVCARAQFKINTHRCWNWHHVHSRQVVSCPVQPRARHWSCVFWRDFSGVKRTCWTTGSWRSCLSLEVVSSIPAWSTIIYRFLCGFICVSLCQSIKIKPTNMYVCMYSSVGLSAGIQSAGDLVSETLMGSNPAFSRGRQLVSFRFEYRLPVPEHRN